jgi:hypothetical protein
MLEVKYRVMGNDVHFFQPIRRELGFWCGLLFIGILINVRFLLDNGSMILFFPLVFLIGIFVLLFVPFLKNQKIMMYNKVIHIFTFGRRNELVFCKHLKQIVIKDNEAISYRFEKNGKYFQISPRAYYENEELALLFSNLSNKCKGVIPVVEK